MHTHWFVTQADAVASSQQQQPHMLQESDNYRPIKHAIMPQMAENSGSISRAKVDNRNCGARHLLATPKSKMWQQMEVIAVMAILDHVWYVMIRQPMDASTLAYMQSQSILKASSPAIMVHVPTRFSNRYEP